MNPRGPSKPQQKEYELPINEEITAAEVRIVGENVENGVYSLQKATSIADELGLDLVMITDKSTPPVCRILDFSKFLYERRKKEKEIKANTVKTVIKEIRFGPNTDDHDFQFKLKHAQKFLAEGSKVKAYVHFRGRAIVFKERGELLLLQFAQQLEELGKLELMPKLEGKRMFITIAPKSVKTK
jgi:translation initiation factor IF-3